MVKIFNAITPLLPLYRFDFTVVVVPFICLCIEGILLLAFNDHQAAGNEKVLAVAYVAMARPIKFDFSLEYGYN